MLLKNLAKQDSPVIEMDLGGTLEIKVMKETGIHHMIGRLEVITEEMIEASVTVGQGQALE